MLCRARNPRRLIQLINFSIRAPALTLGQRTYINLHGGTHKYFIDALQCSFRCSWRCWVPGRVSTVRPVQFSWVAPWACPVRLPFPWHFLAKMFSYITFPFFLIWSFNLLPPRPCISCCSRAAAALSTPDMSALYPCLFVVYWWHDKQGTISVHSKSSTTIFLILEIHSLSLSLAHTISLSVSLFRFVRSAAWLLYLYAH